ncbi:Putative lipoprotein [Helicobacter bizzozeronii]|uniref:COG3014 family protein n=1 Tax=Helicobacter bizzozeronii TaxID=56877 RepID=UPI00244D85EB|nr:hypothetical protein [Helicobacter bizzozeronii]GMB93389.1 Putative lipoprotein [Helicobacter bizzozeronii]
MQTTTQQMPLKQKKSYAIYWIVLLFLFLYGCTGERAAFARFDRAYYSPLGMQNAYTFSQKRGKKDHKNALLWHLDNGMSALMLGHYKQSIQAFNAAEAQFDRHRSLFGKSMGNLGAILINDNVKSYTGSVYESVFLNYYKAMDYWLLGDINDARVEFNRANDRQRRAKEFYHKEIKKAISKMQEKGSSKLSAQDSTAQVDAILAQDYSNLDRFQAYNDLINPAVSYLSGLFYALNNDRSKGIDYIKEAYGISHAITTGEDLLFFANPTREKFTWIFIEDGKQATKQEFKIDLPLPLPNGVYDASLALPQFLDGSDFHNSFSITTPRQNKQFEELVYVDGLIASEFKKQLPYILTRAITSTILKLGIEALSNNYLGVMGGLVSSLFAMASASADIRNSITFPRKIYIARILNAPNEQVSIQSEGQPIYSFSLQQCPAHNMLLLPDTYCSNKHNILYIRSFEYTNIVKVLW